MFGFHEWRVLDVSAWGRHSWHTWKVRRECERCGAYSEYHERNERRLPKVTDAD